VRFNRTLWQVIKQLENEVLALSEIISWVEVSVIDKCSIITRLRQLPFSQSALRKGCPNRNPYRYIHSIISFVFLYETS
jgi:hypothetical protein